MEKMGFRSWNRVGSRMDVACGFRIMICISVAFYMHRLEMTVIFSIISFAEKVSHSRDGN